jgi:hypothetical protein
MTQQIESTEQRIGAMLEEQNRLLQKADRRGGCLWNLVMVLVFGVFYIAWLVLKWTVQVVVAIASFTWQMIVIASLATWRALRWAATLITKPFRKEGSGNGTHEGNTAH